MASVLSPAELVGAPTCSCVSHPFSQPSLASKTRSMECSQQSPRDPCLLKGEYNLQGTTYPIQKAKRLIQPLVHTNRTRPGPSTVSTTGTYVAWRVQGQKRILFRLFEETPSVSQGRDREGHEYILLFPCLQECYSNLNHRDGVWLVTGCTGDT